MMQLDQINLLTKNLEQAQAVLSLIEANALDHEDEQFTLNTKTILAGIWTVKDLIASAKGALESH